MSKLRVDSRWWYWVAAVPLVTAFWAASSLWVGVVAVVVPEAVASAEGVVSIPAVALGVPAVVAFLVLPLALWLDARAIDAAGGDWPAATGRPAQLAAAVDVAVVAGGYLFFEGLAGQGNTLVVGAVVVVAGAVAGSWLCVRYLRGRAEHVAMPSTLWEWRDELRAGDRREPAE